MKIIDILNIVAQGGVPPKKIEVFGLKFIYTEDKRPQRMYKMLEQDNYLLRDFVYTLNTKVEVIEEPEEEENEYIEEPKEEENEYIEDIEELGEFNIIEGLKYQIGFGGTDLEPLSEYIDDVVTKVNEIIEVVNKLKNMEDKNK